MGKIEIVSEPDVLGYWWAHENLPPADADWLLVFVDVRAIHYGDVTFKKEDFDAWIKANFEDELREIYRQGWRLVKFLGLEFKDENLNNLQ